MVRTRPLGLALALALGGGCSALDPQFGALASAPPEPDAGAVLDGGPVSFARDIRPLMNRAETDPGGHGCKRCHDSTHPEHVGLDLGGLDLATLGSLRRGGATSGPRVIVAGDPDHSVLVQKLRGVYPFGARMPRDGPAYWSVDEIALVGQWITEGAVGGDSE